MREDFASLLRSFRNRVGRSRNKLAHEVFCDPSYLTRIEHGDREPPRLHIVEAIARALSCSITDRNRLLIAAGYAPVELGSISWEGPLQAVADVLGDSHLSPEDRDAYSTVILQISARWRGAATARQPNGVDAGA